MSFLAIDCGTSGCKAAVVAEDGRILAWDRRAVRLRHPGPACAEIDPDELWAAIKSAARAALRRVPGGRGRVRALGVSALLGYVFLGKSLKPLGPAVIWMDNRAAEEAEEIRRRLTPAAVYARTGRRISPELLAPKLLWFRRHRPAVARRIRTVIGLKDEMVRRLTGSIQTDFAHLDYSLLFDVRRRRLDPEILAELEIDPDWFPQPHPATDIAGVLTAKAAAGLGLREGLPVICGSSDGTTAMYGGGVLMEGAAVLVSGTTDVLMTASRRAVKDRTRRLTVNTGMLPGVYLVGGAMGLSGGALQYLERLLSTPARPLSRKIRDLAPGADGLLVLPGLTGERAPYWLDHLGGGIAGLRLNHRPEHIFRAAMEAAVFRVARLLELLRGCGLEPRRLHVVGGYADLEVWNRIRSDATGLEVLRPDIAEATALGTAMFCRAAMDEVPLAEIATQWLRFDCRLRPNPVNHERYRALAVLFEDHLRVTAEIQRRLRVMALW